VVAAAQLNAEPVMVGPRRRLVAQQRHRTIGMTDDDVGPAVVIEIPDGDASANRWRAEEGTALRANVAEEATPVMRDVVQQHGTLRKARPHRLTQHVTVDDHQIQPAVIVDVQKIGAEADVGLPERADSGGLC